jgi:hypothetical protein
MYRQVCRKDKNGTIHFYNNKVFTYIEQTNKNGTVHFYWPKTAREEDREPRIMDRQQEHEMRVQLGRERGVRLINEGRETAASKVHLQLARTDYKTLNIPQKFCKLMEQLL